MPTNTHSNSKTRSRSGPFLRQLWLVLAWALLVPTGLAATEPVASAPARMQSPNILLIFIDDLGWKDVGFMGSDFYETPHLDRLASQGMVFRQAYACAANCAPARACLLSGQYTPRHEIYNVGTTPRGKSAHRRLEHIAGTDTLNPDITTWAQVLQRAGYRTATMGKWHLSKDPLPYGFDVNIGGTHSGGPPKGYYPPHGKVPGLEDAPADEYVTDRLSQEACQFIEDNRDRPWMLYLTHFAVHTPLHAKKTLVPKYEQKPPGKLHQHVPMATMIQSVDDGIGQIVATLERLKLQDQTVIMFYSDNGGYGPATDMAPLKGYKGTYYEGGIRVPFMIHWPGKIAAGVTEEPISGVDLFPTFCEIAGAPLPANQILDGTSMLPVATGKRPTMRKDGQPRSMFWHFPAYLQSYGRNHASEQRDVLFRSRPCSVIRQGDWKLIQWFESGDLELFNLAEDLGETTNRAATQPERTQAMLQELKDWQMSTKAAIPRERNPAFDAEKEADAIRKYQPAAPNASGRKRKSK